MTHRRPPQSPLPAEEEALARHREALRQRFPMPEPTPRKPRKPLLAVGLLLAVGAALGWLDPSYREEHYASPLGQTRTLQLADGSQVQLDSGTRLTVSWHLRSRRMQLDAGQALFDISRTMLRPLQVSAGTARIRVLGTRFNVLREGDDARVALLRGSVDLASLRDPTQHVQLAPGQQAQVRGGQLQPVTRVDVDALLAWQQQRLVFQRTPLAEALAQIRRYRAAPVVLDDPRLATLPISGVFNSGNVEQLLDLLPQILPLQIARGDDGSVHLSGRAKK
ncbi:MAG: Protein FecR [Pseudomonas citronellolis]|nr:MAG: Protein FecR [Pseudomonas citronellolis]